MAAAGCGAAEPRLDSGTFRARANAACAEAEPQFLYALAAGANEVAGAKAGVRALERELELLEALRPPAQLDAMYASFLDLLRRRLEAARDFARGIAGDSRLLAESGPLLDAALVAVPTAARRLGLRNCAASS